MSYFIFIKNKDNLEGSIYKIAENENDLNNLNIIQSDYKIIEDNSVDFNLVKCSQKIPLKYNNNVITFIDPTKETEIIFNKKEDLKIYVDNFKTLIKNFTINNVNHPSFNKWNEYYTQLNNLNLDSITYPLNNSLEKYFYDLGQPSLNILQLP